MLTPHHRKDSELGKIRFAAENFLDSLEFFRRETVFRHQLRSHFWIGGRFSAGHRQRTLTEAERDSTRLRTPASGQSLTLVLSLPKKERRKNWDGAPDRARSSARFPSPLRLPRWSLAKAGSRRGQG